jgi:K(+)-stimulated pyrophosphate-energized sodium pump
MNILIKLTCLIGLVIAPILGQHSDVKPHSQEIKTEIHMNADEISRALSLGTIKHLETVDGKIVATDIKMEETMTEIGKKDTK